VDAVGENPQPTELAGRVVVEHLSAAELSRADGRPDTAVGAFLSAARAQTGSGPGRPSVTGHAGVT
jgi:hypothetical protein